MQRHVAGLETAGFVRRTQRRLSHGGKATNSYDLGGLVKRLRELEPEFREVEEKARAARRAVSRPRHKRNQSEGRREPAWREPVKQNPGRIPRGRGGSGVYEENMVDRGAGVKSFLYTEEAIEEIEASLSRERLGTYLDAAGGDR